MANSKRIKLTVQNRYTKAAQAVAQANACCDNPPRGLHAATMYAADELAHLPPGAVEASLGCANPVALAALRPGEVVLDLGSGGGMDVLLTARRVGPAGKAYGLDMTDAMLELARGNQRQAGVQNAEFLKGEMEDIPLPNASVDVIISNCVVNLSPDKGRVLREAFRVLRPGGRLAIADIVARGPVPAALRERPELWTGCIAGALEEAEYVRQLSTAGFTGIEIEMVSAHTPAAIEELKRASPGIVDAIPSFTSAFVRARKP